MPVLLNNLGQATSLSFLNGNDNYSQGDYEN